jgi:predicted dehydrogenase
LIAKACGIHALVDTPAEVVQDVDAVLVLTDDPDSHLAIAEPVIRAGLPVFIDKPLAPDELTARRIADLGRQHNAPWFSGSAFRFSPSLLAFRNRLEIEIGTVSAVYIQCPGWMEQYGIHTVEILNTLLGCDVTDAQGMSLPGRGSAMVRLNGGQTALIETIGAGFDPPAQVLAWGERGSLHWACHDVHRSIFALTAAFINMAITGKSPVPTTESLELAQLALTLTHTTTKRARADELG